MNSKTSITTLLVLLIATILFHISIIAKVIPYDIAWGGRLKNDTEMYIFESLSILIILFWGLVLLMKGGYIKYRFMNKTINIILWIYFVLFLLNTIGNIFAKTLFEKSFSVLTFVFALLIWTILKTKSISTSKETKTKNNR